MVLNRSAGISPRLPVADRKLAVESDLDVCVKRISPCELPSIKVDVNSVRKEERTTSKKFAKRNFLNRSYDNLF